MMVRVELGVNRSMEEFATPSSGASYPRCRAGRRASVGTNRWWRSATNDLCRCTIHRL